MFLDEPVENPFHHHLVPAVRRGGLAGVRPVLRDGLAPAGGVDAEAGGIHQLPDPGRGHRRQKGLRANHIGPIQIVRIAHRLNRQREVDHHVGVSHRRLEVGRGGGRRQVHGVPPHPFVLLTRRGWAPADPHHLGVGQPFV
jgi:hypothetical protein